MTKTKIGFIILLTFNNYFKKGENIMFEHASRLKLRYESFNHGGMNTEDLWDISLNELDYVAKELFRKLNEINDVESFINKTTKTDTLTQLKFDIVKHIIDTRHAEVDKAEQAEIIAQKKKKIMNIIERKRDDELVNSDIADLEKMLTEL